MNLNYVVWCQEQAARAAEFARQYAAAGRPPAWIINEQAAQRYWHRRGLSEWRLAELKAANAPASGL